MGVQVKNLGTGTDGIMFGTAVAHICTRYYNYFFRGLFKDLEFGHEIVILVLRSQPQPHWDEPADKLPPNNCPGALYKKFTLCH